MNRQIRILSSNPEKIKEIRDILNEFNIDVIPNKTKLEELQTDDVIHLVKDKALKAYKKIGRPLIVEHTGLYIEKINGLPGGLTQIFWDTLQADKFAEIFGADDDSSKAQAKTTVCYVDGKNFKIFEGKINGSITNHPKGDRTFQWDCIFIPDGKNMTFAEMGTLEKNKISMRKQALNEFAKYLNEQ